VNTSQARRRRWPRFKLSTILVLVAIAAWGMSMRPFWTAREERQRQRELFMENDPPIASDDLRPYELPEFDLGVGRRLERIATRLQWPILALAAFLTWKWVAARRKRRWELVTTTC